MVPLPSRAIALVLLAALLLGCGGGAAPAPSSNVAPNPDEPPISSRPGGTQITPVPLPPTEPAQWTPRPATPTVGRDPAWEPVFGVEIWRGSVASVVQQARDANVTWVRYNGILWPEVEATEGQRDWATLAAVETELQALSEAGLTPIVIVRNTPEWAQKVPSPCGPIRDDKLPAFASFMGELVARYSAPPFNVRYWELGNEPDVDPALVDPAIHPFGCWGDASDPFYGGGYYAEMLRQVYPAVKGANPDAQVVLGGLLLDCDPSNPPEGKDCLPARFLEGILQAGGGDFFDMAAFHAYGYYNPQVTESDLAAPTWLPRGGTLLGKLDFVRDTMAQYGVDKPVLMNEGGLLCYQSGAACPNEAFFRAQAAYLTRLYTRSWVNGLRGAVWYTLNGPGWREGGLLDTNQQSQPAYQTLQFLATWLDGATYARPLSAGTVEGYEFQRDATRYQVRWTTDAVTVTLPLPDGTQALYDPLGQPLALDERVEIGSEPVFMEIAP